MKIFSYVLTLAIHVFHHALLYARRRRQAATLSIRANRESEIDHFVARSHHRYIANGSMPRNNNKFKGLPKSLLLPDRFQRFLFMLPAIDRHNIVNIEGNNTTQGSCIVVVYLP
jgi:hypothetical protein